MPKCRNDTTRSYKGTEPSPKGLGWCAHGEKEGKKRKGKDGNMWVVKVVKNGSKRWMKQLINKELYKMWSSLSDGKSVIFIYKSKKFKIIKTKKPHDKKIINKGIQDNKVIAILTASNSSDGYKELLSKAKMKTVKYVLNNYKKFFIYPFPELGKKGFII